MSDPTLGPGASAPHEAPPPATPAAPVPAGEVQPPRLGSHIWVVRVMLTLAAVLSVFAIFAVWANRQLLDSSYWAATNTKLLENSAIRSQLSSYLTGQVYANVDVAGEIRAGLPKQLKPLAGPAAGGLRGVVEDGIGLALETQQVQQLWRKANEVAHRQLIELIENKNKVIRTPGGGAVVLELRPIVANVAQRLGAPASVSEKIPANVAQIKIVNSKALRTLQSVVRALRSLAIVLPALALLLFAGAVALARGRRSRTLLNAGLVLIAAAIVTLLLRSIIGGEIVNTLASTEAVRPAARAAWSIGTSVLVDVADATIFIGLLVVLAGLIGGGSRWATATRRGLAPYLRERPDITFATAAMALLLLFLLDPIEATHRLTGILLFTAFTLVGVEALRRQTASEFPDAPYVGGMGFEALRRRMGDMRASVARGTASLRSGAAGRAGVGAGERGGSALDSVEALERLALLHASGALTDEEFAAAKHGLLRQAGASPGSAAVTSDA